MTKLELYNTYKERLENIYQIFVSVFKNPFVDRTQIPSFEALAQNIPGNMVDAVEYLRNQMRMDIIIHFPKITVENEFGKTHDIYDFFIKVSLFGNGNLSDTFKATRTSFTINEIRKGYVHSHFPRLYSEDPLRNWYHMCLGTGPITHTIRRLFTEDFDEATWLLFCTELEMYLGTESIKGGPYIQMSELGNGGKIELKDYLTNILCEINSNCGQNIKRTAKLLLENKLLKFSYYDNKYCLGEPFENLLLKTEPFTENTYIPTTEVFYDGMSLFVRQEDTSRLPSWYENLRNVPILTFKGEEIKLKTIETNEELTFFKILHPDYVREAINIILMLVNNYYKAKTSNNETRDTNREEEDTPENKHIRYILG